MIIKSNSVYKEMKNKYTREDEMASSCKQMRYCDDRHKRRCNRFTYKNHLRNRTELIVLMYLALFLLHYQKKTFVECMQIMSNELRSEIYSEFVTTHIPQLYMDTHVSEEKLKVPISDNFNSEIQDVKESYKDVQYLTKNTDDKTNDFEISTERNAEIKNLSEIPSGTTSSENLELSIRNPVKFKIKTDKHLKSSSPALKIIKEFSKLDNLNKSIMETTYSNKDKLYSFQAVTMKKNNTNSQAEASTTIFEQQQMNNKFSVDEINVSSNLEDSFSEVNETKKLDKYKADTTKQYYNNTLRSLSHTPDFVDFLFENEDTEKAKTPAKMANVLKDEKENFTKDETKEFQTQIKHFNRQNSSLTHIIFEAQPLLTFDSIDLVAQSYDNNYNDNILSVELHETISTSPNNVTETKLLNLEEYTKSDLGEITDEFENTNNTCIDEELKHVVIKKVLDAQEIFDDPLATTTYPFLKNDLQLTYTEQNDHENDVETTNLDSMYPYKNHTTNIEKFNDSIETDKLIPKNITVSTGIEESDENISTTNIKDYYQSTEAIEKYESNYYFNKTIRKTLVDVSHSGREIENLLVIRDSDQNPEQGNMLNRFENIQNEPEQITDNAKIKVGDLLWTSDKQEVTVIDDQKNKTEIEIAEIDKYIKSMETTTEKSESNFNLNQNQHPTDITEMNNKNHEQDTNQDVTLKNAQHESERFDENNSAIVIPDLNKFSKVTEKYENNYISTTIENEQIEAWELGKPAKGPQSVSKQVITLTFDNKAATLFEAYPPRDVGQTFNDNLADESAGIGKALPVSVANGSIRSTIIIILSSGTAILFIVISVTIFLISFQRQNGTLDIEMHERNFGKDGLDEEDAQAFAKLLDVELSPSIAVTLDESEECL